MRNSELISSEFGGEFVVVDPATGVAHALGGDAAVVWRCVLDGSGPALPDRRVDEVIAGLVELGLLQTVGVSRRTVLKAGAAGGMSLALLGIASMALPTAAMAGSPYVTVSVAGYDNPTATPYSTSDGTYYISIPADGAPVQFSLYGAGGGAGGNGSPGEGGGGAGAQGAFVTGYITNNTGSPQVLTVFIGQGGGGGLLGEFEGGAHPAGGTGGSSGLTGGAGGNGNAGDSAGNAGSGAGGGASAILAGETPTVLVVAGAGGGGQAGNEAGYVKPGLPVPTSIGTGPSQNNGTDGYGGGGGGAPAGAGGVISQQYPEGSGGFGGYSWWQSTPDFTLTNVTVSATSGVSLGGQATNGNGDAGTDGSASFSGYSLTQVDGTA